MYVSIGNGRYVRRKQILGIFDFDSATVSSVTRDALRKQEKEGTLSSSEEDIPKALLLVTPPKGAFDKKKKEKTRFYLSKFSSGVLTARAEADEGELGE
ncbi:MAG: hypothetical protein IJY71_02400 [Clostridia bacterium]|nr:hypothetical protein [Clostridia bacterium]